MAVRLELAHPRGEQNSGPGAAVGLPVPNLVILGAQKSGTTSLHGVLKQHPNVFMSQPKKEPTYFFPEAELQIRMQHYNWSPPYSRSGMLRNNMIKGYANQPVFGEASTDYTFSNRARRFGIPERMHSEVPSMRFLYMVRNPFERILSSYRHSVQRHGAGDIEEYLASGAADGAVLTSSYAYQLEAYLEYFGIERFHVLTFEDFVKDQRSAANAIFRFLGLTLLPEVADVRLNVSQVPADLPGDLRLPRTFLERIHGKISEDAARFADLTGISTDVWDLRFERWCT